MFWHSDYTLLPSTRLLMSLTWPQKIIWIMHKSMNNASHTPSVGQWKLLNTKEYNNCSKVHHTFISVLMSWTQRNAWRLGLRFSCCDDSAESLAPCGLENLSGWVHPHGLWKLGRIEKLLLGAHSNVRGAIIRVWSKDAPVSSKGHFNNYPLWHELWGEPVDHLVQCGISSLWGL